MQLLVAARAGLFGLLLAVAPVAAHAQAQRAAPASEALFRRMLMERPDYASQPGQNNTVTIQEFHIARPVRWTMEFGQNPTQDRNTMVYRVRARYTVHTVTFNTATGQRYSSSSREYRRWFNYYIDRRGQWVGMMTGTTSDWH